MVVPASAPARAAAPVGGGSLRLLAQTDFVAQGGELLLTLAVQSDQPVDDLELALAVFPAAGTRSALEQTMGDHLDGDALKVFTLPMTDLTSTANGTVMASVPVQDPAVKADRTRLSIRKQGVYPVQVALRESGGGPTLASLVTHLLYVPQPATSQKLEVGLVLPVHAALDLDGQGRTTASPADRTRISGLAAAVLGHPTVPLTLAPTPATLDTLQTTGDVTDRTTLGALGTLAVSGRTQFTSGAYVPISLPGLAAASATDELTTQLGRGADALAADLATPAGRGPDPSTWIADEPVDQAAVDTLADRQVARIVVREENLAPLPPPRGTLTQPFVMNAHLGRHLDAWAADPLLTNHFDPGADPVLAAHRMLAELAVVQNEAPSLKRGVLALAPRNWTPDPTYLDTLLTGIAGAPILQGATLDQLFNDVPPLTTNAKGKPVQVRPPAQGDASIGEQGKPGAVPGPDLRALRRRMATYARMVDADNPLLPQLDRLALFAVDADRGPDGRRGAIAQANALVESVTGRLQLPPARSLTLTSRTGELPVTVANNSDFDVRVVLRAASDKLRFNNANGSAEASSEERELVVPAHHSQSELFRVEALTSGAFPLDLTLRTPDGTTLARSRFSVRSTAFSGVGVILSAGALVFLIVWWGRSLLRGRRRKLELAVPETGE